MVYSVSFSVGWDLLEFPKLQVHPRCMVGERERKVRGRGDKKRREEIREKKGKQYGERETGEVKTEEGESLKLIGFRL